MLARCIHVPGPRLYLEIDWQQWFEKKIETKHFVFYVPKGDEVNAAAQEQFYEYITDLFEVEPEKKIIYIKCRDSEHLAKITGLKISGNNIVLAGAATKYKKKNGNLVPTIVSIEEWENHELVHILQRSISKSTEFFNEGLAMAYQIDPFRNIYFPYIRRWLRLSEPSINLYLQRGIIEYGEYISISEILTSKEFRALGDQITEKGINKLIIAFTEAGSFVKYLIDNYELETFFQFLKLSDYSDSKAEVEEKFLKVYEISIQEMEEQWLSFLEQNYYYNQ